MIVMVGHIRIRAEGDASQRDTEYINADWGECCHLLGQLELAKKILLEYMDEMKADLEIKEK